MDTVQFAPYSGMFADKSVNSTGFNMRYFHFHKAYELYYLQKGTRRYFINDHSYLVGQGSTVLLGSDDIHKTGRVDDAPHTRYVINLEAEYLAPLLTAFPAVNPFAVFSKGVGVLSASLANTHRIEEYFEQVWRLEQQEETPVCRAQKQLLIYQLLLFLDDLLEAQQQRGDVLDRVNHPTVDKACSYITSNYTENLTLERIAAQVYVSPSYLSRLFRRTTNLSIVEYCNLVRVRAAKELLETTTLSVSEVAQRVGYQTTTHFSRMFRKGTGRSPAQYRKKYGAE